MENNQIQDYSKYLSYNLDSIFCYNQENHTQNNLIENYGLSEKKMAIPEQVHSDAIKWIESPGNFNNVDGLVTDRPGIILCLKVADCVPIYIYDSKKKIISLVHSGWRGTKLGIVSNAIKLMKSNGAYSENIFVYMGPAIGICCYEVDYNVARFFSDSAKNKLDNNKWKVNMYEQIRIQLAILGVPEKNIQNSKECTFESRYCHSYRRDGVNSGRMYAFMRIKK